MGNENDVRDIRERLKNGHAAIVKPGVVEEQMQMRLSIQKNQLQIEFAKSIDWMRLSKAEAGAFIQALVQYHNMME